MSWLAELSCTFGIIDDCSSLIFQWLGYFVFHWELMEKHICTFVIMYYAIYTILLQYNYIILQLCVFYYIVLKFQSYNVCACCRFVAQDTGINRIYEACLESIRPFWILQGWVQHIIETLWSIRGDLFTHARTVADIFH